MPERRKNVQKAGLPVEDAEDMGEEYVNEDDILEKLVELTLVEKPPSGYYTIRQLYEAALKVDPELDYGKYRHRIRKMVEKGMMKVHYIGRNVWYGLG